MSVWRWLEERLELEHTVFEVLRPPVPAALAGRIGWYSDPLGDISGLTFGIGVNWKSINLDFGSIPQARNSDLDNVKKITLGYHF